MISESAALILAGVAGVLASALSVALRTRGRDRDRRGATAVAIVLFEIVRLLGPAPSTLPARAGLLLTTLACAVAGWLLVEAVSAKR